MSNDSQRGGLQQTTAQTGSEKRRQGVHPGSTSQSAARDEKKTGSEGTLGPDKHAGEQVVPKKESYETEKG
jgi:hypothetical protein